jgi:RHS repeat-associated protein
MRPALRTQKVADTLFAARMPVLILLALALSFAATSQVAAADSTPYTTAVAIPGTWEAENFDLGGEGVAYHDNAPGNAGGLYRTDEDVDIFVSNDPSGGAYIVKNFETGEWLNYTISVPTDGNYDFELRVSTHADFPNRAYRLYVDGADASGLVPLPDTGGWAVYQWAGKKTVALTAGTHILRIASEQQYFDMNQIRMTATPAAQGQIFFIHADHLNTPRLVANATGTTVWRWDQAEPFGANPADENPSGLGAFDLPLRLPGQYFDKETGLHYNYFRDYDPSLGIYKQSDLIGLQGGLNTYAYVAANALTRADFLGLAGSTTHGLRKCFPSDTCPVLLGKIEKLIASLQERRTEMVVATAAGQSYSNYHGHAMQIVQQVKMLQKCRAYYEKHQPPCCDPGQSAPNYDPYPLPDWTEPVVPDSTPAPSPVPTPPNQTSNSVGAAAAAAAAMLLYLLTN